VDEEETENDSLANSSKSVSTKFVASKWETIDPEKLEKQAITTSKWDFYDDSNSSDRQEKSDQHKDESDFDDDIDGKPMDDDEL
jgi:hypothetical protein